MQKRRRRGESGQSMIEFLLVVAMILGLLFAYVQLAWGLAWGHYVHYATFMAGRAYFSAQENRSVQEQKAVETLTLMLKKRDRPEEDLLGRIAPAQVGGRRNIDGGPEPVPGAFVGTHPVAAGFGLTTRFFSWAEGVQYNFRFRLFPFPFASMLGENRGKEVTIGEGAEATTIIWDGNIGLASDAFLGREVTGEECRQFMEDLETVVRPSNGGPLLFDNGC